MLGIAGPDRSRRVGARRVSASPQAVGAPLTSAVGGLRVAAAVLVCGSAVLLFAVHVRPLGYVPLVLGILLAVAVDRALARDLGIIALGMSIVSAIPLAADLSDAGIARFAVALSAAVLVPWAVSRYGFGQRSIVFPCARAAAGPERRSSTWSSSWPPGT
ncbi:hypothetical protein GCM10025865_20760 [Paraoerskovia sediminicola]|uniref:Uncharacterized protein n=1 Tax=Paraoerskovia sediminicola TaxID=1138587 RepID=A0ABN6XD30_9CELL|nr:hypothetical protein GCM10025865_20760 [Paraoerskovia sediminicola]